MRMQITAGMGMSVSLNNAASLEQNAKVKTENKVNLEAKIQASTLVRAATQVQVLQALVASSRIVVESDAEEEDFAEIADAAEDDYDSEVDFIDDDEIRDEDDSFGAYAAPNGEEASPLDSILRCYEIRIVEKAPGRWACIPPLNPLRGYRPNGYDSEAHQILEAVRKQFAFYEAVAGWLLGEGNAVLESPAAFRRNHMPKTQKDFIATDFCANLRSMMKGTAKKANTGNVHAYCQSCRLSWGHASLPLDYAFKKLKTGGLSRARVREVVRKGLDLVEVQA